ncbi:hypothetical protein J40TS1_21790 [Paenibacillus montaniterrae]|uniref:HTH cro/C1-type domain-containing protein n=1 Tax=Paenibacillus montaniterrae TaxID=429341 RepID=A0A920CU22_9BACL|nr:helix-turn-helix transcriptional regulator [Paenibacillus montaniterrae]GIP16537.1 hypothetical protein J40TS1_21790 [Paenibacillus montaniterrae]
MKRKQTVVTIGKRIRYYRTMRNLTQEELAERISTTGSYVGRMERGERNMKVETLEKVATALNLSLSTLISGDNDPLQDHFWVQKSVLLLLEQDERGQKKAFLILNELFSD